MNFRSCLTGVVLTLLCGLAFAQTLPPQVSRALIQARIPLEALSLLVVDAEANAAPRLSHRSGVPVNPASVMKLVTTYAALDLLGPAYAWRTPVYVEGTVRDGTLFGNLYIKGVGDPALVTERLWLLLRRVQGLGIRKIAGDIVLDGSAFEPSDIDPAGFDGKPLSPYNAVPDALLINFKSVVMTFVPERSSNTARVQFEPPLSGVQLQTEVPLSSAECGDYQDTLKADFSDATRIRFAGVYPTSCLEKVWSVAYTDPKSFNARAIAGLWQLLGGQLAGSVREGLLAFSTGPVKAAPYEPVFEVVSPSLLEVIRDINKYSNNVMAQQLFMSLSLPAASMTPASTQASRDLLVRWWRERISPDDAPIIDNGSGLSRSQRISAQALGQLLLTAFRSPVMPEMMSSLPITGVDGTLKKRYAQVQGSAHLKTGSLRDVAAVAGYVQAASGKRYVLVAIVNHPNAAAARPAFEALLEWAFKDN